MADRQVVAFHEVLGQHLPVRVPHEAFVEPLRVVRHVIGPDQLLDIGEMRGHRFCFGVERHHEPAKPFFAPQLWQTVMLLAEALVCIHGGRTAELAVRLIAPAMIGTGNDAAVAAAFENGGHAVQADIRLAADLPIHATDHHQRLASEFKGDVVAGLLQGGGAANAIPFLAEDMRHLRVEELRRGVNALRHGAGLLEGQRHSGGQFGNWIDRGVQVHRRNLRRAAILITNSWSEQPAPREIPE